MSETVEQALTRRGFAWLTDCGFDWSYDPDISDNLSAIILISAYKIRWAPAAQIWLLLTSDDRPISESEDPFGPFYKGTQPEFAVFLRQLRGGRLPI